MTNSDRLQEIRERAEAATPGPWRVKPMPANEGGCREIQARSNNSKRLRQEYQDLGYTSGLWDDDQDNANAKLFAASREDIPYLLQLVTEQQREIERLKLDVENALWSGVES